MTSIESNGAVIIRPIIGAATRLMTSEPAPWPTRSPMAAIGIGGGGGFRRRGRNWMGDWRLREMFWVRARLQRANL